MQYAEIGPDDLVRRVVVIPPGQAQRGADYLALDLSLPGEWVPAYDDELKPGKAAAPGDTYMRDLGIFAAPKPFPSWLLDEATGYWNPPVPMPDDGTEYDWDEPTLSWQPIPIDDPAA